MELSMRNNGKVYSKRYRDTQLRASVSADRATDEERTWAGVSVADGQKIDPNMYRTTVVPTGSRYEAAQTVDLREASPYRKDGSVRHR